MHVKERVALIIPPSCFLASEKVFISLGILRVAACLKEAGHPVSVLDLNGLSNYSEVTENFCKETDAKVFGLSVVTPQFPYSKKIVQIINDTVPGAKTIGGGPHITSVCSAYKREKKLGLVGRAHRSYRQIMDTFTVCCAGDGEESVMVALQPEARGLIDADDPESQLFLQPYQLENYPFPARSLIALNEYEYMIDGTRATSYLSQLGCCFPCVFCNGRLSPSFRRVRSRSSENLKEEVKQIYSDYGFIGLMDYSDEMNLYPTLEQDMRFLMDLQDELGVRFKIRGFVKSNIFTREQARIFRDVGVVELCVGAESGSDRILKNIQKKSTVEQNTRTVDICHEFGIRCKAFCSLGHAGESEATIEATRDWLVKVKPDDFDATCIVCFGGTQYYDFATPHPDWKDVWVYEAKGTGDRLYQYDVDFGTDVSYYKGIPGDYRSTVFTDYLSAEKLVTLRDKLEMEVRSSLKLPFYQITPSSRWDHSMGVLDLSVLRHSDC